MIHLHLRIITEDEKMAITYVYTGLSTYRPLTTDTDTDTAAAHHISHSLIHSGTGEDLANQTGPCLSAYYFTTPLTSISCLILSLVHSLTQR